MATVGSPGDRETFGRRVSGAKAVGRGLLRRGADTAALHSASMAALLLKRKTEVYLDGSWELRLVRDLPPGATALDVGAHIGMISNLLAPRFGQVVAVEPNPQCLARLHLTMPSNVIVVGAAAGARPGSAALDVPVRGSRAVAACGSLLSDRFAGENVRRVQVATIPVDELVDGAVDFLKIDVEGFEPEVLEGATRVLAGRPTVLIEAEEQHRPGVCAVVDKTLSGYDLTGWFVSDGAVLPMEEFDPQRHQRLSGAGGAKDASYATNFLYVPREEADGWRARLGDAVAGRTVGVG